MSNSFEFKKLVPAKIGYGAEIERSQYEQSRNIRSIGASIKLCVREHFEIAKVRLTAK